jgi:hypothetical protein
MRERHDLIRNMFSVNISNLFSNNFW